MLKITINNEEVVSNKDFTIEEEMLNTSSVILNNVYPKSWENDKDYVSRFYHPNDYSKCLIKDEDYTPAEPGLNEEGTNFQITADTTKLNELTSMKGNTSQSGTPTPTTPVPINVVSGRQDVMVIGKNLFDIGTSLADWFQTNNNGLRINSMEIGRTTATIANNKLTINSYDTAGWTWISQWLPLEKNTNYTISGTNTSGIRIVGLNSQALNTDGTLITSKSETDTIKTFNSRNYEYYCMSFYPGSAGKYLENIQLEKGSQATEYEAYKGNTYEINLGKNLSQLSSISTTNGGYINRSVSSMCEVEKGITYTLSFKNNSSYTNGCTVRVWHDNTYTDQLYKVLVANSTMTYTFTATYSGTLHLSCKVANDMADIFTEIQLEKGSSASTYAPYKTPIELCKIGNYQDRIYKNGNKWYLEKKIGKVVLNGSQNITQAPDGVRRFNARYSTLGLNNIKDGTGTYDTAQYRMCDHFRHSSSTYNAQKWGTYYTYNGWLVLYDTDTVIADANALKTWFTNNPTSIYYVQATTTTTEITDTELISQLNSIELLEGLNNVSVVSPYLQGIINIHYNYVNETTTSDLLFCGVVKNSGNISLNPRHPHYQTLQILDFKTFLSEGETLDFVIANKTIEEAIDQVVDTISPYGFIKGNIEILGAETIIGAYSTKDKTAYDVFNYLADITQSRWTTRLIDENTVAIDFYDPTLLPRGEAIQYNETWFRNNLIDDISYSYGSNDYRNKQVMTSKEVIGELEQVQIVYANGYQTQFMTEIKIAQINEIDVNGEPKTFATEDDKELGVEADFYYSIGNNIIESADTYPTGAVITIRYLPIVEGRQIITNNDEIDRVSTATGRKGVVARYEDRNDAITSNELQLIGQSYIRYKGVPEIKLNVQTRSNLWNIGDRVQFNAPITELATEYMVKKKTINRILANPDSEEHIIYTFELTSSFNSEQAINYFDNQRAKSKGNIGEGEAISRNIDIENETNIIFYDSNIVEITVVGDNVLNSTLNSPLNN